MNGSQDCLVGTVGVQISSRDQQKAFWCGEGLTCNIIRGLPPTNRKVPGSICVADQREY
jgi:hypothetical protein